MTKETLEMLQRGHEEVRRFQLEELRKATPAERLKKLDLIWCMAHEMKISVIDKEWSVSESSWAKLQRLVSER